MAHRTVPRPRETRANERVQPKVLSLLKEPPHAHTLDSEYPALPCPRRDDRFTSPYTVTTHIIPAAFPRVTPFVPLPPVPEHESKDERSARVDQYATEFFSLQIQHASGKSKSQPTVLWSVLNRYVRADTSRTGLTLVLLHANGLHKETFEPTLHHLFEIVDNDQRYQIDEVWALDAVQHGDSGLINAQNLGSLFIWDDHARDILNFILHFLPEEVTPSALPTYLPKVPHEASEARKRLGFTNRKLVVVGHSMGGCTAALAAYSVPAPFSGLILIDPVIRPSAVDLYEDHQLRSYVIGALSRRSVWRSREEAYSLLTKSPFFGAWEPDVLRNYIEYALFEDVSGQVRLKCMNFHEAAVFADGTRCGEAWSALPYIDERIPVKWLVPPSEMSVLNSCMQEIIWSRPENSSNALISTATHLMVQDSPREVAKELHEFLLRRSVELRSSL